MSRKGIEAIYPLSPMQQGLLFHSLYTPGTSVYNVLIRFTVRGDLRTADFHRAWDLLVERHGILRTSFIWERVKEPLQVVRDRVHLLWREEDWRGLSPDEQAARLAALTATEHRQEFDLSSAPLMRVTLIRKADEVHELVWALHHILLDGWSVSVLLRELCVLYETLVARIDVGLERPRPYRDYIAYLRRQDSSGAEAFWSQYLSGVAAATPLAVDRRSTEVSYRYADEDLWLSTEETAELQGLARDRGVTLNTVIQAAWAIVLSRYGGADDVVFGATVTNRPVTFDGAHRMIGLFLNTVPVRIRVPASTRLGDWLQLLQREQAELHHHQNTPLADIQRWSEIPRGASLFESLLVFENYPAGDPFEGVNGNLRIDDVQVLEQTNYPLTIAVFPGRRLLVRATRHQGRLEGAGVARMLGHLKNTLLAMVRAPQRLLSDVEILDEVEALALSAGPAQRSSGERCLHREFEAQVARTPERVAVVCEGEMLTYRELNRRANGVARRLRALGVGPEVLVGLCVERSLEMVVGILAILKAGGAYVPLDPTYPPGRLAFMLEDAAVPVLLTQERLVAELPPHRAAVVALDAAGLADSGAGADGEDLPGGASPDNLAYVIYTSGSTGQPKGTLITHRNVARLMEATEAWYGFGPDDVWTLFHSYAFDFSVWELWGALWYGGRLVVVPYWVSRSPESFLDLLEREQVTVLNQTPSAFRQLAHVALEADGARVLALRYVIFGGEALELQGLRPWFARYGDRHPQLVNMYGITETTVHVTYRPITMADVEAGTGSVIGVPIPDLAVYLLDRYGKLVPIGVPGELYVGGAGVGRGYLNRPELTASRFVPDPFSGTPGARLYRSGDLARRLPDGDLEYLGRLDHQVKIRGFRIELGEIEAALAQHPAVREVVALVREDRPGDRRLVAYVRTDGGATALSAELRAHAKERLPEYMVPAAIVALDALPLTGNGKIDRAALPAPEAGEAHPDDGYRPPTTPEETLLARIWAEVLRVDTVGADQNFFELGGDSILSIQVIARARAAGLRITPKQMFEHPTVAELAQVAERDGDTRRDDAPVTGPVPLTPIQRWFFERDLPGVHHFNQAMLLELRAALDPAHLDRAVQALVEHHDGLRLRFRRVDGDWRQVDEAVGAAAAVTEVVDLSGLSPIEQDEAIAAKAAEVQTQLDISAGPVVRVALFELGDGRPGRLLVVIHHLAVDGVSWRILLEDLQSACELLTRGEPVRLPPKTTSFKTWAERLGEHAGSATLRSEAEYWLAGDPSEAGSIVADFPEAANTVGSTSTVSVALTENETTALLRDVPRAYGSQINDALLSALARALPPLTGGRSVLVDLEGHGREPILEGVDLSRTVGWFTSMFPVRLEAGTGPAESLKMVKERLRSVPGRGVGYGVLRYLSPDRALVDELRGRPRAEVSFNYLGQVDQMFAPGSMFGLSATPVGPSADARGLRAHLLEADGSITGGRLKIDFNYGKNVFRRATIEMLANGFAEALCELIEHCESPEAGGHTPSDFPLVRLDQAALDRLLDGERDIEDVYPLSAMQQLFYSMEAVDPRLGLEQWHCMLRGPLEPRALECAWGEVLERHTILRTTFRSDGLREPVQIVRRSVRAPWCHEDLRYMTPSEQSERLRAYLDADRDQGFDLAQGPIARFALHRTGEDTYHFLWTTHHLLIDGWSWPLVFKQVAEAYVALVHQEPIPAGSQPRFREYIEWMSRQDVPAAETFWRSELDGFKSPTLVGSAARRVARDDGDVMVEAQRRLSADVSDGLRATARRHRVTLSALVQGAWAVVVSRWTGSSDVVIGAAFSGRPAELPGVESMVGPCVNNLPIRVPVNGEQRIDAWLAGLHERREHVSEHQWTPLAHIQAWTGIPWRLRLFDSLLVFQNYQVDEAALRLGEGVEIRDLVGPDRTNYPLTVFVLPGQEINLRVAYDGQRLTEARVARMLDDFEAVLTRLASQETGTVAHLLGAVAGGGLDQETAPPAPVSADAYAAPETEAERIITGIWQEAFAVDRIGVDDNFFDLGGHSLLMLQVHSRLREALKADISIVKLFQYPTVRALARHLADGAAAGPSYQDLRGRADRRREALARRAQGARRA